MATRDPEFTKYQIVPLNFLTLIKVLFRGPTPPPVRS